MNILIYIKNNIEAEKLSLNIIKKIKNINLVIQKNIETIFKYKNYVCKEKKCKIIIKILNKKKLNIIEKEIKNCLNNNIYIKLKK